MRLFALASRSFNECVIHLLRSLDNDPGPLLLVEDLNPRLVHFSEELISTLTIAPVLLYFKSTSGGNFRTFVSTAGDGISRSSTESAGTSSDVNIPGKPRAQPKHFQRTGSRTASPPKIPPPIPPPPPSAKTTLNCSLLHTRSETSCPAVVRFSVLSVWCGIFPESRCETRHINEETRNRGDEAVQK